MDSGSIFAVILLSISCSRSSMLDSVNNFKSLIASFSFTKAAFSGFLTNCFSISFSLVSIAEIKAWSWFCKPANFCSAESALSDSIALFSIVYLGSRFSAKRVASGFVLSNSSAKISFSFVSTCSLFSSNCFSCASNLAASSLIVRFHAEGFFFTSSKRAC